MMLPASGRPDGVRGAPERQSGVPCIASHHLEEERPTCQRCQIRRDRPSEPVVNVRSTLQGRLVRRHVCAVWRNDDTMLAWLASL
jgi:hypothetical protein